MDTQKRRGGKLQTTGKAPANFSASENVSGQSEPPKAKNVKVQSAKTESKSVKKTPAETEAKSIKKTPAKTERKSVKKTPATAGHKNEGVEFAQAASSDGNQALVKKGNQALAKNNNQTAAEKNGNQALAENNKQTAAESGSNQATTENGGGAAGDLDAEKPDEVTSEKTGIISPEIETNSVEKETVEEIGISEEIINEKIQTVIELQKPKKRKRSMIINIILLIVNLVLMFFIVKNLFVNLEDTSLRGLFSQRGEKMWWLAGGVVMYGFFVLVQVLIFRTLIKKLSGRKSWRIAYDTAVVGKYYDNITPFAVGGQGMQILSLVQNGIGAGVATSIPILKMMINSGINALLALLFFVFGIPFIPKTSILNDFLILLLEIVGVIGLIITVLIALFILLISSGTLITRSLISGVLRLGYKLRIIKDYRTTYKKVMNQVTEYKFSMSYLWKHKKTLLELVFLSILECLSYASLVFFVAMAFIDTIDGSIYMFIFLCIAKYYLCAMASCYIPLPGGTGLMEISFILLFGMTFGSNIVWALIFWRFLTYYLIIIHGFVHELVKITKTFVSNKKRKTA